MKSIVKKIFGKKKNSLNCLTVNEEIELERLLRKYYQEKIFKYIKSIDSTSNINVDDYKEEIEYLIENALMVQDSKVFERIAERYYF